jgi:hypothetical protein
MLVKGSTLIDPRRRRREWRAPRSTSALTNGDAAIEVLVAEERVSKVNSRSLLIPRSVFRRVLAERSARQQSRRHDLQPRRRAPSLDRRGAAWRSPLSPLARRAPRRPPVAGAPRCGLRLARSAHAPGTSPNASAGGAPRIAGREAGARASRASGGPRPSRSGMSRFEEPLDTEGQARARRAFRSDASHEAPRSETAANHACPRGRRRARCDTADTSRPRAPNCARAGDWTTIGARNEQEPRHRGSPSSPPSRHDQLADLRLARPWSSRQRYKTKK